MQLQMFLNEYEVRFLVKSIFLSSFLVRKEDDASNQYMTVTAWVLVHWLVGHVFRCFESIYLQCICVRRRRQY